MPFAVTSGQCRPKAIRERRIRMEPTVPPSRIERRKQGKALREKCPRTSQAEWEPRKKSQDIVKLLEESDEDRIAGLIPVKYQRMSVSPFTFFRGAAILQARDLRMLRCRGSQSRHAAIVTWRTLVASRRLNER